MQLIFFNYLTFCQTRLEVKSGKRETESYFARGPTVPKGPGQKGRFEIKPAQTRGYIID